MNFVSKKEDDYLVCIWWFELYYCNKQYFKNNSLLIFEKNS